MLAEKRFYAFNNLFLVGWVGKLAEFFTDGLAGEVKLANLGTGWIKIRKHAVSINKDGIRRVLSGICMN